MYLYPSSLKKHYSVAHEKEYEKYLEDKKSKQYPFTFVVETCGFHLKEGDVLSLDFKLNNSSQN